ncbi:hypothetical protein CLOP_g7423, partial [Closterium sp. NIES-67]
LLLGVKLAAYLFPALLSPIPSPPQLPVPAPLPPSLPGLLGFSLCPSVSWTQSDPFAVVALPAAQQLELACASRGK